MKKKSLPKTATLSAVIHAVNDVKKEIMFIRKDSINMESHLADRITQNEKSLKNLIEVNHSQVMDKLNQIIEQNTETNQRVKKLEQIHPGGIHATF